MAKTQDKILIIAEEAFYALGLMLAVLIVIEAIKPKIVLAYVNLNLWLVIWSLLALFIIIKRYARSKNH